MKIAVLSGKGGTGKTLVSVNLASVMGDVTYIDADVEEPNGNIFFKPTDICEEDVCVTLPAWNKDACNGCKRCVEFCAFNALAYAGGNMLIFDEVCHACGGCALVCPNGAFTTRERSVGKIMRGRHGDVDVLTGELNMGEASGVPIIKSLLQKTTRDRVVIDCPPGSQCNVMESIKDADLCVLVAEPTIFGVHNLDMVVRLAISRGKRIGVVLNKAIEGENIAREYALTHDIPILGEIMWDERLCEIQSRGGIAVESDVRYRDIFESIRDRVLEEAMR